MHTFKKMTIPYPGKFKFLILFENIYFFNFYEVLLKFSISNECGKNYPKGLEFGNKLFLMKVISCGEVGPRNAPGAYATHPTRTQAM